MPILPYAKKMFPRKTDEDSIKAYMMWKDVYMEADTVNRIFGIKNKLGTGFRRVGYILSRDYYEGDQWLYAKEEGASMNVVNFCRMTVDNYTAFLTQEAPELDIPPQDVTDEIEVARANQVEKLVNDILDDNDFYNVFYDGVQNGSILGDTIIVGPFYDQVNKRIRFWNVKRPEYVRIIWKSEDYDEVVGYILHYYLSVEEAWAIYGEQLTKMGVDVHSLGNSQEPAPTTARLATDKVKRVYIREIWDDQMRLKTVDDHVISYDVHNFGFVPLVYVKNMPHPYLPWGTSDIEDVIDPQITYNETSSDMRDILKQIAFPSIFGKNLDVESVQAGVSKFYDLGDESEVFPDPRKDNFNGLQTYLTDRKNDINTTSGVPDAFQGGKGVENLSGRALSVIMTPINNRVRGKEHRWGIALSSLVKNMLILLEHYIPDAPKLIQHQYKANFFFPGTLVRDVTEELNKFIQKTQSQYTTMKNIGIATPKDEQTLIKKELSDPQLLIELSKNPQMQAAVAQQMVNGAMPQGAGAPPPGQPQPPAGGPPNPPGQPAAAAANGPVLGESQNQGNEAPASAAGNNTPSTATPGGNVVAANRQKNAPVNIRRKR